ncbi:MAG: Zn-dependent hydrolase, partial [Bacillota bacterium]
VSASEDEMEALAKLKGHDGLTYGEVLEQLGLDPKRLGDARRSPESLKGYFELHIEQGGLLESEGLKIGVVEGIVGITRHWVTFRGNANHAGTTPMHLRKDALVGASEMVLAVRETVHQLGGRLVGTVGFMEITPGGVNVVPGAVRMSIELRDMDAGIVAEATGCLAERASAIADRYGLTVEFKEGPVVPGVPTHAAMQSIIEREAQGLGLSTKRMISGAGHDAEHMATITPTGMIFVPSKGGISHSPAEWTEWDDVANGAQVMLNSVVKLDQNR